MQFPNVLRRFPRRASIMLFSVGMMVIAGTSTISWVGNVNQMQHTAARDRARLYAINAAEAGVEQIVDYFNNPANYTGALPAGSEAVLETSPHPLTFNIHPQPYLFFEPYVLKVSANGSGIPVDSNGAPIVDSQGNLLAGAEPVVTSFTFLTDLLDPLSSRVPTMEVDISDNPNMIFNDEEGRELARVTSIHLVNPNDFPTIGDAIPVAGLSAPIICKVIATATTPRGVTMRVETILTENRMRALNAPAAIISEAQATFDGHFNVYFGEVWTKGDGILKNGWTNNNHTGIPKSTTDPWFAYRTEASMVNTGGQYLNGRPPSGNQPFTSTPTAEGHVNYHQPLLEVANNIQQRSRYLDRENLWQNQQLDFPEYEYHMVKEFFVTNGIPTYFQTPNGQIAGIERNPSSPDYGQYVVKSYNDWFDISPSDPNYWNMDEMLVFIDTVPTDASGNVAPLGANGVPIRNATYRSREPRADRANVRTIQAAGNSHTRGAMFIYGDIRFAGQGNAGGASNGSIVAEDGSLYLTKPNGTHISNSDMGPGNNSIAHNGLQAVWGTVDMVGNRSVYGSVFAGQGFAGGGSRAVYYNWRMRDGNWLNINQSSVRRNHWTVRGDDPTDALAGLL